MTNTTAPQEAQQEQVQALWSDERIERAVGAADFRHYEDALAEKLLMEMRDEYENHRVIMRARFANELEAKGIASRAREDELRARVAELEGQLKSANDKLSEVARYHGIGFDQI